MTYLLTRIAKGRHACIAENEGPRDLLISIELKHELRRELDQMLMYRSSIEYEELMGMRIEWKPPRFPEISIRTAKGDVRIVR